MASIFLSYAREDAAKAQRIARALEGVGHQVWWDRQLRPGERFSAEIDRALKSSDVVVALWSKASIDSPWVQDEAGFGRDNGRLVPVLLEAVTPPLGFRQFHAADLSRGRLSGRLMEPLVKAVEQRLSAAPAPAPAAATSSRRRRSLIAAGAVLLLLIAVGGWWIYGRPTAAPPTSLVVETAAGGSPAADLMAKAIANELGRFQAGPLAALEIEPADDGRHAAYRADVSLVEDVNLLTLRLSLGSRSAGQLWSTSLEGPSNGQSDLLRQAAARLGASLACDFDLQRRHYNVSAEVRRLYIDGCSRMADATEDRNAQAINLFRQVTQKAPRFAPAWAHLGLAEFNLIWAFPAPESEGSNIAWMAGRHSVVAGNLDRSLPEPYFVRAFDGRRDLTTYMPDALSTLEQGLHLNPDSALLLDGRATALAHFGRLQEALGSAKQAVALDPLSVGLLRNYVMLLAYTGQTEQARREIDKADATWPRSKAVADVRFEFEMRFGDPTGAMRLIRDGDVGPQDRGIELFLQARAQPTQANIEAALKYYRARFQKEPADMWGLLQTAATFGRIDEAYRALEAGAGEAFNGNGEALFRPALRGVRADPRFIGIAHRAGMLSFWRKSRVWPDFCRDPQLPYDCRKEAAKYPLDPPAQS